MKIPRILLAAGASGSGKTLITCGILQALVKRGKKVASFKCGPDYIDPMFHSRVIGTQSANLDTFFTNEEVTRYLLAKNSEGCDIAVMEGVMGYYDGVGGTATWASAYDLAQVTDTSVILIVNSKGMSVSLAAYIKGFLEYRKDSHIEGVIFNQISPMLYPRMKELVEQELGIAVLGYVPKVGDCVIESRHLGLVLPEEIPELKGRLEKLADILETTLDMEAILKIAEQAGEVSFTKKADVSGGKQEILEKSLNSENEIYENNIDDTEEILEISDKAFGYHSPAPLRIGVAEDEAFCFFYKDNFRLLREMGAELVFFSPVYDENLPENLDGLLLYGGYPELKGRELEQNSFMRETIKMALENGMPCMAECGGFMYLHEEMEDMDGNIYQGVGAIEGRAYRTKKLNRFGYITLERNSEKDIYGKIPAHEFHYFDSTNCGEAFKASKPVGTRSWNCIHDDGRLMAGFPHLYYYGNPKVPREFLERCLLFRKEQAQVHMGEMSKSSRMI